MNIPDRLSHLPRHGELPIPYTTPIHDGRPDFRKTDPQRHNLCVRFALCGVCGKHVSPPYTFLVAPVCLAERLVFGAPTHPECAHATLTLCPYQARLHWKRHEGDGVQMFKIDELPPKPARIGIATCPSYQAIDGPNGMQYSALPKAEFPIVWWSYNADGVLEPEGTQP